MPLGYLIAIFIFLIAILSAMRGKIVYEISGASLLLFATPKLGVSLYSLIFLPGTIIHELSHWIVAEILRVRTGEISIFPDFNEELKGGEHRLGSVATEKTDPLRGSLIGVAPFISGLLILIILGSLLSDGWANYVWWQLTLIIYGVVVVSNSMLVSKADRRSWPFFVIFSVILVTAILRMRLSLPPSLYLLSSSIFSSLNLVLGVTAGINLVMIVGLYSVRKLIEKITKRRIL